MSMTWLCLSSFRLSTSLCSQQVAILYNYAEKKQLMAEDEDTGGYEEFLLIDEIQITEEKYILIIEAKRESLGAAMGQCLLAMKDIGDRNHGGVVYGFVSTGDMMVHYHNR